MRWCFCGENMCGKCQNLNFAVLIVLILILTRIWLSSCSFGQFSGKFCGTSIVNTSIHFNASDCFGYIDIYTIYLDCLMGKFLIQLIEAKLFFFDKSRYNIYISVRTTYCQNYSLDDFELISGRGGNNCSFSWIYMDLRRFSWVFEIYVDSGMWTLYIMCYFITRYNILFTHVWSSPR